MAHLRESSAEHSPYFENLVATRSAELSPDAALDGAATLSLETQEDLAVAGAMVYIESNFPAFLANLRFLSKLDQEALFMYYLLCRPQRNIARLQGSTQSLTSFRLRMAMKRICGLIMSGPPTAETMRGPFLAVGLEHSLAAPLSVVVELYAQTRSFHLVAEQLHLHRPSIRRAISVAAKTLADNEEPAHQALSAYLADLVGKASTAGVGPNAREQAKHGNQRHKDPAVLGQFRVAVESPGFDKMWTSNAKQ